MSSRRNSKKRASFLNLGIAPRRRSTQQHRPPTDQTSSERAPRVAARQAPRVSGFAASVVAVESPDVMSIWCTSESAQLTRELQMLVRSPESPRPFGLSPSPCPASSHRPWTAPDTLTQDGPGRGSLIQDSSPPWTGRPCTADSPGLSPLVVRHNQTFQAALSSAENCAVQAAKQFTKDHADLANFKPSQRLDAMLHQIQEVSESLDSVRGKHSRFVTARAGLCEESRDEERHRAAAEPSKKAVLNVQACSLPLASGHAQAGALHHHAATPSDPGAIKDIRTKMPQVGVHKESALPEPDTVDDVADAVEGEENSSQQLRQCRAVSKTQANAKAQFSSIDSGKVARQDIFESVTSDTRRVEVKLDFFRGRKHLLPQTLNEYMHIDESTGERAVNIGRLHSRPLSRLRANHKEDLLQWHGECKAAKGSSHSTSVQVFSHMSSSSAGESLEQRTERLRKRGESRDLHIAQVREAARSQLSARRHALLHEMQHKDLRNEEATRERAIFTWVTLAMATETLARLWQNFVNLQEVALKKNAKWRNIARGVAVVKGPSQQPSIANVFVNTCPGNKQLMPSAQRLLLITLQRKAMQQDKGERSRRASLKWWTVIRCTRFVAKLLLIRRCSWYAEIIKDMINTYWRGYQLRASMKTYLQQMKFLQFSIRSNCKLRSHLRHFIYMPVLWEVETVILADVIAMPKSSVEAEIEKHRSRWDLKARLQEVRRLSDIRGAWQAHVEHQLLTQRTALFSMNDKRASFGTGTGASERRRRSSIKISDFRALQASSSQACSKNTAAKSEQNTRTHRASHPMMEVIDKYRLDPELRHGICQKMLRENVERWWHRYLEYKDQRKAFQVSWQQWRLEVCALGPHNRHVWPMCPAIPRFPCELMKTDEKWLHKEVLHALRRHGPAGQLL